MTAEFFQACQQGDAAAVRQQLEQNTALANAQDDSNNTPLMLATQAGHADVVRELLAHNADPRHAQALVSPSDSNGEALQLLREAALHADTRLANGVAPSAQKPDAPEGSTNANLPPPEVARLIPCRFFPNCRYGDRCLFQHPTGPMMPPPQGAQPMFFPGPNGMPFSPAPGAYGVPPPQFMEMNPPMFTMHYGPNGVPFYPQQPMPAPDAAAESTDEKPAPPAPTEGAPAANPDVDALANSMDTLGSSTDAEHATTNAPRPGRPAGKGKNTKGRNDGTNTAQRNRANNGSRPSCAFFARSACRYANDCRFPHILPDGTDARTLPSEDGKTKGPGPRRAQNSSADRAADAPDSPTSGAPGSKKSNARNARASNTNSTRGKGARRGTAPTPNRKTVQRVPHSDEFPALPGGAPGATRTDANEGAQAESNSDAKPKANFSAILSAPAPPKPAKTKQEPEESAKAAAPATSPAPSPAPAASESENASPQAAQPTQPTQPTQSAQPAQQPSGSSSSPRDFAAVAAAQPNAVSA